MVRIIDKNDLQITLVELTAGMLNDHPFSHHPDQLARHLLDKFPFPRDLKHWESLLLKASKYNTQMALLDEPPPAPSDSFNKFQQAATVAMKKSMQEFKIAELVYSEGLSNITDQVIAKRGTRGLEHAAWALASSPEGPPSREVFSESSIRPGPSIPQPDVPFEIRRNAIDLLTKFGYTNHLVEILRESLATNDYSDEVRSQIANLDIRINKVDINDTGDFRNVLTFKDQDNQIVSDVFEQMNSETLDRIHGIVREAGRTLACIRKESPAKYRGTQELSLWSLMNDLDVTKEVRRENPKSPFLHVLDIVESLEEVKLAIRPDPSPMQYEDLPTYINDRYDYLIAAHQNREVELAQGAQALSASASESATSVSETEVSGLQEPEAIPVASQEVVPEIQPQPTLLASIGKKVHPAAGFHFRRRDFTASIDLISSLQDPFKPSVSIRIEHDSTSIPEGKGAHVGLRTSDFPVNGEYQIGFTRSEGPSEGQQSQLYARSSLSLPVPTKQVQGLQVGGNLEVGIVDGHLTAPADAFPLSSLWKGKDSSTIYIGGQVYQGKGNLQIQQRIIRPLYGSQKAKVESLQPLRKSLIDITQETESVASPKSEVFRGIEPKSTFSASSVPGEPSTMPWWVPFFSGLLAGYLVAYSYFKLVKKADD